MRIVWPILRERVMGCFLLCGLLPALDRATAFGAFRHPSHCPKGCADHTLGRFAKAGARLLVIAPHAQTL
jgi:hypothetical protein